VTNKSGRKTNIRGQTTKSLVFPGSQQMAEGIGSLFAGRAVDAGFLKAVGLDLSGFGGYAQFFPFV
jgi:hypothetical protein